MRMDVPFRAGLKSHSTDKGRQREEKVYTAERWEQVTGLLNPISDGQDDRTMIWESPGTKRADFQWKRINLQKICGKEKYKKGGWVPRVVILLSSDSRV